MPGFSLRCCSLTCAVLLCMTPLFAQPPKPSLPEQAWNLLHSGVQDANTEKRTTAVRVLALLPGDPEAARLAVKALQDEKPEVRAAAALALGEMHYSSAIPALLEMFADKDTTVVIAAAHSLLQMHDKSAYDVYYAILTGERKTGRGVIAGQMDRFKDPKKVAELGFEQAIGFIPFAGMGYTAIKTMTHDDASPVRAAAARVLADDPDPATGQALLEAAVDDKNWIVRAACLEAIARRGDPSLLAKLGPPMDDDKDAVKYTAAATVLRLSAIAEHKPARRR